MDPALYNNLAYIKSGFLHQRMKMIVGWDSHLYFGGKIQLYWVTWVAQSVKYLPSA